MHKGLLVFLSFLLSTLFSTTASAQHDGDLQSLQRFVESHHADEQDLARYRDQAFREGAYSKLYQTALKNAGLQKSIRASQFSEEVYFRLKTHAEHPRPNFESITNLFGIFLMSSKETGWDKSKESLLRTLGATHTNALGKIDSHTLYLRGLAVQLLLNAIESNQVEAYVNSVASEIAVRNRAGGNYKLRAAEKLTIYYFAFDASMVNRNADLSEAEKRETGGPIEKFSDAQIQQFKELVKGAQLEHQMYVRKLAIDCRKPLKRNGGSERGERKGKEK